MIAEIQADLKNRGLETIGSISYNAKIIFGNLKGAVLSEERATREAAEILDFLMPQTNINNVE